VGNGDRNAAVMVCLVGRTGHCKLQRRGDRAPRVSRPANAPVASTMWQAAFRCGFSPKPTFEIIWEFWFFLPNALFYASPNTILLSVAKW
jgi:hypothetical protein